MPIHRKPRNEFEKIDRVRRKEKIKSNVNLAFDSLNLSKREFAKRVFPYSIYIIDDSKNVFNWLRTGQIAKPMLIPFSRVTGVPIEFLLGEENEKLEQKLKSKIRPKYVS